ncbi:hypothetical protein EJ066_16800 [Mesorhizobium sp. M9A.F.Ca.ET.002.03.1.2]|uniref:hypothetical protein n=1 Tax=Mesorhizobium sp. M9A.F.Ca.ET.002.03.1.2 TaxID=2493668 RepID=UPI000F74E6B1|nr:hypothetical protein [Mesorhizobium sp. M9A.F.Ca.ET.002.03.1.2]AZN98689.1 hypothetical protein EJ066_16800 [Mesorhizobium sp. M9A.F.Ca.ET.002.03.1.2]
MAAIKGQEADLPFRQFLEGSGSENGRFKIRQVSVSNETQRKPKSHFAYAKRVGIKAESCYALDPYHQ